MKEMIDVAIEALQELKNEDIKGVNLTKDITDQGEPIISINVRLVAETPAIKSVYSTGDYYSD